jgi:hypothetical protein
MEVLRVPPYPIVTIWDVSLPNTDYTIYIEDLVDHSVENISVTSTANSQIEYTLPRSRVLFDREFLFRIYTTSGEIEVDDNLTILRPYINPNILGTTASEIAEYKQLELLARSMIDTIIQEGFYNRKHIIQTTGQGTDYFSIWKYVNRILKVYENNTLVYDADTPETNIYEYVITLDNSAIQRVILDTYDRAEQTPPNLPVAMGDLGYYGYRSVAFPAGYDYTFVVDGGYKAIPADVEYATKLLIEDIKCGKLDYYKRYITSYNTDQFKIQFDKGLLEKTGNLVIDTILDKYSNNLIKPGLM